MPLTSANDPLPGIVRKGTVCSDLSNSSNPSSSTDANSTWSDGEGDILPPTNTYVNLSDNPRSLDSELSSENALRAITLKEIVDTAGFSTPAGLDSNDAQLQDETCWERQVALSLDGGGIRGLAELLILQSIMQEIARVEFDRDGTISSADLPRVGSMEDEVSIAESQGSANVDNFLPCHYFDYICGTSLGGVIAVMLGRLRLPVSETIRYYEEIWNSMANAIPEVDRILPGNTTRAECSSGISRALDLMLKKEEISRNGRTIKGRARDLTRFQSDQNLCKTLVLAVENDKSNHVRRPYLFRSYPFTKTGKTSALNRNIDDRLNTVSIKDVCMATSASPGHFRSYKIGNTKFRDGSIWMANPAMELYREIDSIHSVKDPLYCLVSIGSGRQNKGIAERTIRPFSPGGILRRRSTTVYDREQKQVDRVLNDRMMESHGFSYFRFDGPDGLAEIKPKDWKSLTNRKRIRKHIGTTTERHCREKSLREAIEELAVMLVNYRRRRAPTRHWDDFVDIPRTETTRHSCRWCNECQDADRNSFIDHVKDKHSEKIEGDRRFFEPYRAMLKDSRIPSIVAVRV